MTKPDPISEFLTLASYAKDKAWPQPEAEVLSELNGSCSELRRSGKHCDWLPFYEKALESTRNSKLRMDEMQIELNRESAEIKPPATPGSKITAHDVETTIRRMTKEIDSAPSYLCGASGRLSRQENQIKEAVSGAFDEFELEEKNTGAAIELTIEPHCRRKILQYLQGALENWRNQSIRDLSRFVSGEDPVVMEQLDSMAGEFNIHPFEFDDAQASNPSRELALGTVAGRVEVPKIGGLIFKSLRSIMISIGMLMMPLLAGAAWILKSGITPERGLVMAAIFPIAIIITYFWARNQRETTVKELLKKEQERLLEVFKRTSYSTISKQKAELDQITRKYFMRSGKSFRNWSDDLLAKAKQKQAVQAADDTGKIKVRQVEVNQQYTKLRMMTANLSKKIIPAFENRIRELREAIAQGN